MTHLGAPLRKLLALHPLAAVALLGLAFPLLGAADDGRAGCGDGAFHSRSPAPDVNGAWAIAYDDVLDVRIAIGGSVYEETIGVAGGAVTIHHDGVPITFDLDCDRDEVICPSEVWPATVELSQRNSTFPHRMFATLPFQRCLGEMVQPVPGTCGAGTTNPDCEAVCDGEVDTIEAERFGVINERGTGFELFLGVGAATNGVNCLLLGASVAKADLVSVGDPDDGTWEAIEIADGHVKTGYAGGCLWAGDPDADGQLEALVLGATVTFETGFHGARR